MRAPLPRLRLRNAAMMHVADHYVIAATRLGFAGDPGNCNEQQQRLRRNYPPSRWFGAVFSCCERPHNNKTAETAKLNSTASERPNTKKKIL